MKKRLVYHPSAWEELEALEREIQKRFFALLNKLEYDGRLDIGSAKKMKGYKNLFEIRVRHHGAWRCFYAYLTGDLIAVLHFMGKKTQKTEKKTLTLVIKRLNDYE